MDITRKRHRVLIVSTGTRTFEYFQGLLPQSDFSLELCNSAGEARRLICNSAPDVLLIDTPLTDEFGVELAKDIAESDTGILLLVKSELFDKVSYDVGSLGVLTLSKPNSRQSFYGAVRLAAALSVRLQKMESKNRSLQDKMAGIRAVNRAKWLLIDKMSMTEQDAHYYIEKRAMDARISRKEAAEEIIRTYGE